MTNERDGVEEADREAEAGVETKEEEVEALNVLLIWVRDLESGADSGERWKEDVHERLAVWKARG